MKGINNEDRENFFDRFNQKLIKKIIALKGDKTISRNYRISEYLYNDVVEKLKEYDHEGLTRADLIKCAFVEFAYGDQRKNKLKK